MADTTFDAQDPVAARSLAEAAASLAGERNATLAADSQELIGKASLRLEDYERAEDAFRLAQHLQLALGNQRGVASALTNLGTVWLLQQRDAEAADAFAEAAGFWRELNDAQALEYCERESARLTIKCSN